jgi:hypothetical protein
MKCICWHQIQDTEWRVVNELRILAIAGRCRVMTSWQYRSGHFSVRERGPSESWASPTNRDLKAADFVDMAMSNAARDLPYIRNQSLESADDQYIRTLQHDIA